MKALFAVIALAFSLNASAATELVVRDGYTAPGKWQIQSVATLAQPLPAVFLVPIENAGYCFNGDVNEVLAIVQAVALTAPNYVIDVPTTVSIVKDTESVGEPLMIENLVLTAYTAEGTQKWTFGKLRQCNRTTKPELVK